MDKNFQNQFSGLAFLVFGLVTIFWLVPASIQTQRTAEIGPRFWPLFVAWLIVVLSVALIALEGRDKGASQEEKTKKGFAVLNKEHYRVKPYIVKPLAFPLLGGGYVFCIEKLGFIVATVFALPVFLVYFGSRSYKANLAIGVVGTLLIYFVFTRFLNVRLPSGILPSIF